MLLYTCISVNLSNALGVNAFLITLIVGGIVASITVGGKALGKKKAIDRCNEIMYFVGGVVHIFAPIKPKNTVDRKVREEKIRINKWYICKEKNIYW